MNTDAIRPRPVAAKSARLTSAPFRAPLGTALRAAALALGALALGNSAGAQGAARKWKETIFRPSVGEWIVEPGTTGGLNLFPLSPFTPSSVELLLPPGTPGAAQGVELSLAAFDPALSAALLTLTGTARP